MNRLTDIETKLEDDEDREYDYEINYKELETYITPILKAYL